MKKAIASAGLLALGAIGAQTAMSQVTGGTDKPWSVSATLRGFYDDNINTTPSGTNKIDSLGFEVRPSAQFGYQSGQNVLSASYLYSLRYYDARHDHKYDQSHDFELGFTHNFDPRFSLAVADSFVIAQEPEVLAAGAVSFPLRSNGNNLRNTGSITFNAQLTRLFGLVLGYANTIYSYDENAGNTITPDQPSRSALLDRMENTVTLDTTWLVFEDTTAVLGYKFGAVNYSSGENIDSPTFFLPGPPPAFPTPFIASSTRDNDSHAFYVGADHRFRSDLTASVRIGVQYFDYYNSPAGSVQSTWSPYATLAVNYNYTDGGVVSLAFSHTHNQTDQAANAGDPTAGITQDQESSSVNLTLTQQLSMLSPSLTGSLNAEFQNSDFNGGPVGGASENMYLLGLNLTYHFTRYFSTEVGYNYDKLDSDIAGRSYDRNRVYVGVTATY